MQLYCRDGIILATHSDDQTVPADVYGLGVAIIHRATMDGIERFGALPEGWPADGPDPRPLQAPDAAPPHE